jgi:hypothetical protein
MTSGTFSNLFRFSAVAILAASVFCPTVHAQGPLPDAPSIQPVAASFSAESSSAQPAATAPALAFTQPTIAPVEHRFWDRQNWLLFAVSAAFSGADFGVTRANLQSGGRELNPIVRMMGTSTPALAANFAGETAGVVGMSYLFHRTGHHRLERAVSYVNISASAGAVSYGLAHR